MRGSGTAPRPARPGTERRNAEPGSLSRALQGHRAHGWDREQPGPTAARLPRRAGVVPAGHRAGGTAASRDARGHGAGAWAQRCAQEGCAKLVGRTWSRTHPGKTQESIRKCYPEEGF